MDVTPTEFCVYITVQEGYEEAFLAASMENCRGAREEPGNLVFEIYRSRDNSRDFMFVEKYDSVESVLQHRQTPHFLKWLKAAEPMMPEPRRRVPGNEVPPNYAPVPLSPRL